MSGTRESVVRMANQIARNFAAQGEEQAIAETANHIRLFWDPRMKAVILTIERNSLDPIVRQALDLVASDKAIQSR